MSAPAKETSLRWYRIIAERDPAQLPFANFYREMVESRTRK